MYKNNHHQATAPENITAPVKPKRQAYQEQCEYEERLLRNCIEYIKRTGEFDYPILNDLVKKVKALDTLRRAWITIQT